MDKKNVLIIFGGSSSEYFVSCKSAAGVIKYIDKSKHDVFKLGITMEGTWIFTDAMEEDIKSGRRWTEHPSNKRAMISLERNKHAVIIIENGLLTEIPIDCAFPLIHGNGGEDGRLQGFLELSNIPFVGSSVAVSANSMDRELTRFFSDLCQLQRPKSIAIRKNEIMQQPLQSLDLKITYPLFVKPASAGSSIGVSKVFEPNQLMDAVKNAFLYDDKILLEEEITGTEIKVAIMGKNKYRSYMPDKCVRRTGK